MAEVVLINGQPYDREEIEQDPIYQECVQDCILDLWNNQGVTFNLAYQSERDCKDPCFEQAVERIVNQQTRENDFQVETQEKNVGSIISIVIGGILLLTAIAISVVILRK